MAASPMVGSHYPGKNTFALHHLANHMNRRLIGVALLFLILYAYYPVYRAEFVNYDDGLYIIHNDHIREGLTLQSVKWAFGSFYAANWHPLTMLSHLIDFQIYGMNAAGHHLSNVIFHLGNTLLLFLALHLMTGSLWRSALVSFLFALHPLHVESVAWVSERKDVLSTFFMLLAILSYRRYARERKRGFYALTAICFIFGVLSKPMLVTFPFLLLLLDFWPLHRLKIHTEGGSFPDRLRAVVLSTRPIIIEKIPLFILSVIFSAITVVAQSEAGAVSSLAALPVGMRLANASVAFTQYIIHMLMPTALGIFYPHPGKGLHTWMILASACFILLVTALCILQRRERPFLIMGWLWYAGMLVPVIGIVQVGMQAMADRYTYVPIIGIFIMLAWSIPVISFQNKIFKGAAMVALLLAAMLLVAQTRKQVGYWTDTGTLFSHADKITDNNILAKLMVAEQLAQKGKIQLAREKYEEVLRLSPGNVTAHHSYGMFLASRREFKEGIHHLKEAVRLQPESVMAKNGLGQALMWSGKADEAGNYFLEAGKLKPGFPETHYLIAQWHEKKGEYDDAIHAYGEALRLKPDYGQARLALSILLKERGKEQEAYVQYQQVMTETPHVIAQMHFTMGRSLAAINRMDDAISQYQNGLHITPSDAESLWQLAEILKVKGRFQEADACYRKIIKINPDHEKANVGICENIAAQGKLDGAISCFQSIIKNHPEYFTTWIGLGDAMGKKGLYQDAADAYRAALKIDPDAEKAHYALGVMLMKRDQHAEAVEHFQKALALRPEYPEAKRALSAARKRQKP